MSTTGDPSCSSTFRAVPSRVSPSRHERVPSNDNTIVVSITSPSFHQSETRACASAAQNISPRLRCSLSTSPCLEDLETCCLRHPLSRHQSRITQQRISARYRGSDGHDMQPNTKDITVDTVVPCRRKYMYVPLKVSLRQHPLRLSAYQVWIRGEASWKHHDSHASNVDVRGLTVCFECLTQVTMWGAGPKIALSPS